MTELYHDAEGIRMSRTDVIATVMEVVEDTFDVTDLAYADSLTAAEVDGWDSLSNIRFMVAIEQAFGRRLTMAQWQAMANLGDLVDLLAKD
jgi:acyl carrier protein